MTSLTPDRIVERPCRECKETGVAEYIDHISRPCEACRGEAVQKFTAMEAGLLDQCEEQQATIERLITELKEVREALEQSKRDLEGAQSLIRAISGRPSIAVETAIDRIEALTPVSGAQEAKLCGENLTEEKQA